MEFRFRGRDLSRTLFIVILSTLLFAFSTSLLSAATNVSSDSENSWNPQLVIDSSDNRYLVWQSETTGEDEIYFSRFNAGTWTVPVNVSNNIGNSTNPRMTADSLGILHLTWQDDTPGNLEIFYSKYNGSSWSVPLNISNDSPRSVNPSIAASSSGNPLIVWQSTTDDDAEIYFSRKNGSWSSPVNISNNLGDSIYPQIKSASGIIHVVWADRSSGKSEIVYKRYIHSSWSANSYISNSSGNADIPKLDIDSGVNPRVVWQEQNGGTYEVYLATSSDIGNSWTSPEKVSNSTSNSKRPEIDVDDNWNTHLIWEDYRPASQGLTYRVRKGSSWKIPINITFDSYEADSPSIACDSTSTYYLAFSQTTENNRDIFFSDTQYGLTPIGLNQRVEAGENIILVFESLTSANYSNAILKIDPIGPLPSIPSSYRFLEEIYFDISTTADFSGNVFITAPYDESLIAGDEENRVRLLRWTGSYWQDITLGQDMINKTVTGWAPSLSGFVLAEGGPCPRAATGVNLTLLFSLSIAFLVGGSLIILHRNRKPGFERKVF